jgi:hypothetical protein
MEAVVYDIYGSADVLQLREFAKPAVGDGDILVRVQRNLGQGRELKGSPSMGGAT